jgi:Mg2+/Co2+ transporter CorB
MKTYLILPDVFVSYVTSKDADVLNTIEKTFKRVEEGKIKLLMPEGLFFVLAHHLERVMDDRAKLTDYLESILNLHNLKVRNEMVLRKTILEMKKGKDFSHAYRDVVVPTLALDGVITC